MNRDGFALLVVVMIVVLLAIVVLGITPYIVQGLRFNVATLNSTKALFMAQAGVMRAIVDYRDGGLWNSAANVNAEGEFYYHVGEDANFLLADASNPQIFKNPDKTYSLRRIPIRNVNATGPVTVTRMLVSWTSNVRITSVLLGGQVVWTGSMGSPATLDITDFTIGSGVAYNGVTDQQWVFSKNFSGDVAATFIFGDGSSYKACLLKGGGRANREFSIKATGEMRSGAAIVARRTLVATYDTGTSGITSWEESPTHIMP